MKVWEKLNELKGADASMETIADWSRMNKICPVDIGFELELPASAAEDVELLNKIAERACRVYQTCDGGCLTAFLQTEFE